jgi:integrase
VSLYRTRRSPFWQFDFWLRGHRFHGSTKATNKREAEKIEAAEREKAKRHVAQIAAARTSLRLDDVAGRYWTEHAQHLAGASNTWPLLGMLIHFFGKDKLVTEITDDDMARLVAWRRGQRNSYQGKNLISPFTVNHTTTTLRKLFTRCKLWGVRFNHEPKWSKHLLKLPTERVRELSDDEADRLNAAMRDDYRPFFEFAHVTGWRLNECFLRWSEVNWTAREITKLGKGGKHIAVKIIPSVRDILWPLRGHHSEFVFTYVCEHAEHGRIKGERYPITRRGVQTYWSRLRKASGVVGFRLHDFRHDFATKLLRETGNLKLVQQALNHASIKTTTRYAHVLSSEVADAMERVAKSRTNSRTRLKVV